MVNKVLLHHVEQKFRISSKNGSTLLFWWQWLKNRCLTWYHDEGHVDYIQIYQTTRRTLYNRNEVSMSRCFQNICENSILTSWPWTKVKGHGTKWKPVYGFLYVYKRIEVSISHFFQIFAKITFWPWARTILRKERDVWPCMVFKIFAKNSILTSWPRSKVMAPNESPYMVSYMSIIELKSLSLVVYEIFAKIAFWPWAKIKWHSTKWHSTKMTFWLLDLGLRS